MLTHPNNCVRFVAMQIVLIVYRRTNRSGCGGVGEAVEPVVGVAAEEIASLIKVGDDVGTVTDVVFGLAVVRFG